MTETFKHHHFYKYLSNVSLKSFLDFTSTQWDRLSFCACGNYTSCICLRFVFWLKCFQMDVFSVCIHTGLFSPQFSKFTSKLLWSLFGAGDNYRALSVLFVSLWFFSGRAAVGGGVTAWGRCKHFPRPRASDLRRESHLDHAENEKPFVEVHLVDVLSIHTIIWHTVDGVDLMTQYGGKNGPMTYLFTL